MKQNFATKIAFFTLVAFVSTAEAKDSNAQNEKFIKESALDLVVFNDMYDYCLINVMPGDKDLLEKKSVWSEQYWPATLEMVHYSSNIYSELTAKVQGIAQDEVDLLPIQNRLYNLASKRTEKVFSNKTKEQLESLCQQVGSYTMQNSQLIAEKYKPLKSKWLSPKYGDYDGNAINQAIIDSAKGKSKE